MYVFTLEILSSSSVLFTDIYLLCKNIFNGIITQGNFGNVDIFMIYSQAFWECI